MRENRKIYCKVICYKVFRKCERKYSNFGNHYTSQIVPLDHWLSKIFSVVITQRFWHQLPWMLSPADNTQHLPLCRNVCLLLHSKTSQVFPIFKQTEAESSF